MVGGEGERGARAYITRAPTTRAMARMNWGCRDSQSVGKAGMWEVLCGGMHVLPPPLTSARKLNTGV